MYSMPLVVPCN